MNNLNKTIKHYIHTLFQDITSFGGIIFYGFVLLSVLLLKKTGLFYQLLFGLVFTFIITVLIRTFYFKNRPKKQSHTNYIERIDASSFPSWHTARIFFLTFVFINLFSENILLKVFFVTLACLTSYSRIFLEKHDWVDLIGGFILAIITYYLTNLLF